MRGAAYGAIARPERAALHETFARWLDRRGEGDELVGTHLERAALDARDLAASAPLAREASARLGGAGQRALLSFDYAAAANLLERAAELLDDEALGRMEIECGLGYALKGVGRLGEAIDLLEATAVRARDAGHRPIELRARVELIHPLLAGGGMSADEAAALLDQALVVFGQADDALGIARAEATYVLLLDWNTRPDAAFVHAERADAAYRRLGRRGQMDATAVHLAVRGTTTVREATRACERSLAGHPDSPRLRAYLLVYLGFLRALNGDRAAAREAAAAARSHLQELGEEVGLGTSAAAMFGDIEAIFGRLAAYPRGVRARSGLHARSPRVPRLARLLPRPARRDRARVRRSSHRGLARRGGPQPHDPRRADDEHLVEASGIPRAVRDWSGAEVGASRA